MRQSLKSINIQWKYRFTTDRVSVPFISSELHPFRRILREEERIESEKTRRIAIEKGKLLSFFSGREENKKKSKTQIIAVKISTRTRFITVKFYDAMSTIWRSESPLLSYHTRPPISVLAVVLIFAPPTIFGVKQWDHWDQSREGFKFTVRSAINLDQITRHLIVSSNRQRSTRGWMSIRKKSLRLLSIIEKWSSKWSSTRANTSRFLPYISCQFAVQHRAP